MTEEEAWREIQQELRATEDRMDKVAEMHFFLNYMRTELERMWDRDRDL